MHKSGIINWYVCMSVSNFDSVLNQIILSQAIANLEAFFSLSEPNRW